MKTPLPRLALSACAAAALTAGAAAQTPLSGPLSDSTTGPLAAGVYDAMNISVPAGETLTIDAGAVIKFRFDARLDVVGTLLVQGTAGNPVVFTDQRDDAAGGDTNGDGSATAPAAGWWRGIEFEATASASSVQHAVIRYGGRFIGGVQLNGCDATFSDVAVTDYDTSGFDLNLNSLPTLQNCGVERCSGRAFRDVPIAAVPLFSGLTASGGPGDRVWIGDGALPAGARIEIGPDNGIDGTLFVDNAVFVPADSTLAVDAGTILKIRFDGRLNVNGTLEVNGTAADPVVVTDERDDTVGGDTNADGAATAPAAGWWRGIEMADTSDASVVRHLDLRYGGRFISALELASCDATFENVSIDAFVNSGIDLRTDSHPILRDVSITNCSTDAIDTASITALPGFSGLTASGNGNDWIDVTNATVPGGVDLVIGPGNGLAGTARIGGFLEVASGASLTLEAGMIILQRFDGGVACDGPLTCEGTQANPVWFVDERDDLAGNGAAGVPGAGWWRGITFRAGASGSNLTWTNVLHGGRFQANVRVQDAAVTMFRCRIAEGTNNGMNFASSSEPCSIEGCTVTNFGADAIAGVRLDRVPDFRRNSASGCVLNTIRVAEGSVDGNVEIARDNLINGNLVVTPSIVITPTGRLTLRPDVALRMAFDTRISVSGGLDVPSTFERPVVITSASDQRVADDEGNAPGGAGQWRGVQFEANAGTSTLRGLVIRNGGRFIPNVFVLGGDVSLEEVRSETSTSAAYRFDVAPTRALRLAAWRTVGGFDIVAPDAALYRQLTAAGCTAYGVRATSGFLGAIADSISVGLGASNYVLPAGALRFSNGDPAAVGTDGNIDVDPLFVDEPNGDLNLAMGSPSIDAGDPSSPLDPNGTRADQGAYPVNDLTPEVFCTQANDADCEAKIETAGFASFAGTDPFLVSLVDAPTNTMGLYFYGTGARAQLAGFFGNLCVSNPYARTPVMVSGGDPAFGGCDGRFDFDVRGYLQSGADPNLGPGVTMIGAFWYRDQSAPGGAKFSEAVEIPIGG